MPRRFAGKIIMDQSAVGDFLIYMEGFVDSKGHPLFHGVGVEPLPEDDDEPPSKAPRQPTTHRRQRLKDGGVTVVQMVMAALQEKGPLHTSDLMELADQNGFSAESVRGKLYDLYREGYLDKVSPGTFAIKERK